jgi:hypothetical protein
MADKDIVISKNLADQERSKRGISLRVFLDKCARVGCDTSTPLLS